MVPGNEAGVIGQSAMDNVVASAQGIRPRWIGEPPASSREDIRRDWLECLVRDPQGSIYLHPDHVLRPRAGKPPAVYARWSSDPGGSERLTALAILVEKTVRLQLIPGGPWKRSLKGYRLVGDQMLGGGEAEPLAAFLDTVAEFLKSDDADCAFFENIDVDSPLWRGLEDIARRRNDLVVYHPGRPQPRWWIDFPEEQGRYWQQFSSKTRNTLRRKAKKLGHAVVRIEDERAIAGFLEKVHRVSRKTWQTKRFGLRIKNNAGEASFWRFVASQGAMRCYLLERAGEPLAFLMGIQWNGTFLYEEVGYEPAYADYSPGTVLLFEALQDLTSRDTPRVFDFGFGDADYKRLFANRQTWSGPVLLVRRRWRSMAALWSHRNLYQVTQRMRTVLVRIGIYNSIRKRLR